MFMLMRLVLVVFAALSAYTIVFQIVQDVQMAYVGFISGLLIALFAIIFEERVKTTPFWIVIGGAIGLISGLVVANLIAYPTTKFIESTYISDPYARGVLYLFLNVLVGYFGLSIGMKKGDDFMEARIRLRGRRIRESGPLQAQAAAEPATAPDKPRAESRRRILMDTSVIIDGRIKDICETGFLDNNILVPQFVLAELQNIADSSDSVRRTRGKRGLDILQQLQKNPKIGVSIIDKDVESVKAVDSKLVALAKDLKVKILTNDSNLNKVAELQGVAVLNINMLASALKPVVMPGEIVHILVVKEGKEQGQGVGYLDDGTMVVIDNAREHVGRTIDAAITSVLQTASGRMIFAKPSEKDKGHIFLQASN
jgi:uncharacterized protein YacL